MKNKIVLITVIVLAVVAVCVGVLLRNADKSKETGDTEKKLEQTEQIPDQKVTVEKIADEDKADEGKEASEDDIVTAGMENEENDMNAIPDKGTPEAQGTTGTPVTDSTVEPAPTVEPEPTEEPVAEPAEESDVEAVAEPVGEPTAVTTEDPETKPASEPTSEPEPTPTEESIPTPSATPEPTPTATPTPKPTNVIPDGFTVDRETASADNVDMSKVSPENITVEPNWSNYQEWGYPSDQSTYHVSTASYKGKTDFIQGLCEFFGVTNFEDVLALIEKCGYVWDYRKLTPDGMWGMYASDDGQTIYIDSVTNSYDEYGNRLNETPWGEDTYIYRVFLENLGDKELGKRIVEVFGKATQSSVNKRSDEITKLENEGYTPRVDKEMFFTTQP